MNARTSWILLAVVAIGALLIGARADSGPRSFDERAAAIKESVQCPVCDGQNVLESNAPVAVNIRSEIDRLVEGGRTDDQIRTSLAATYGQQVILNPSGEGATSLVWILPVVMLAAGAAGLDIAFRQWRSQRHRVPTDAERALVADARAQYRAEVGP